MNMPELRDDPALTALISKSIQAFNALSPEDQGAMRRQQRRSWVIGEMMLEHPDLSREYVEGLVLRSGY